MFKWLTSRIDNARIAFAYVGYERECKQQWMAEAESTFSTVQLEQEIKTRMAEPMNHVAQAFDAPIRELEAKRENVRQVVSEAEEKLAILERDYKSELDAAYKTLNETREQLNECRRKLSSAYDDLADAKRKLDAWYARAERKWFGNAGKELPKHSFFGQDLSDRDRYKSERDSAARAIGEYKDERSRIERRLADARATVQRIKNARQVMIDLKKAGFDKRIVTSVIGNGNSELRAIKNEIAGLTKAREDFVHQAEVSLGIYELEQRIGQLRRGKDERIAAFDSGPEVAARKAKHRAAWLAARRSPKINPSR